MSEEKKETNEEYTRRRITASPLNYFIINHFQSGAQLKNNLISQPELRKPTRECHLDAD